MQVLVILAAVAAGVLLGGGGLAMSERTQSYVNALWTLIDEVLNSVLFLLTGLEMLVPSFDPASLILAATAVPIALLARLVAVPTSIPILPWSKRLSLRQVPS